VRGFSKLDVKTKWGEGGQSARYRKARDRPLPLESGLLGPEFLEYVHKEELEVLLLSPATEGRNQLIEGMRNLGSFPLKKKEEKRN